ncbi:MAG: hypothetical protein IJU62_01475 [Muribaculaceae bacterium]|nr:hypothetical protein [Muribaculaceae bacterium]
MERTYQFNKAQYEIINMLSCINSDSDLVALKDVIVNFLNSRLQTELDRLWDNGAISDETISSWGDMHLRTAYNDK